VKDNALFVDGRASNFLCDVGLPGYLAATAVNANGDPELWLAREDMIDAEVQEMGNPAQPHERLGRLPQAVRDRIWGDQLRCGHPRSNGKPCRARVAAPGGVCGVHREKANR
jgi:hypothetical protein